MTGFSIKKILPRTLLGRSLLILVTPVLLIQVITTYMFFDRHWNRVTSRLAFAVSGEVALLVSVAKAGGAQELQILSAGTDRYLDLMAEIIPRGLLPHPAKRSITPIWNAMEEKLRAELEGQISENFVIHADNDKDQVSIFVQIGPDLLKITFPQRRLFSSSGQIFLLWVLGSSLVLLLAAIIFMRNQIRPIRKLAVAAERFGKGRDSPTFKPEGALEVRQAAHAFLDMRRRIQRQITQRTDMLAGVSHDLRTPLTRMKIQLELLPDSPDVRDLKEDVQSMQKMVQGYLDFVRGEGEEQVSSIEMKPLFQKMIAGLKHESVAVDLEAEEGMRFMARPMAFERALENILSNAAKYADHIWIKAEIDDKKLQIRIEDNGPGIPEDLYDEVFKPFTRVDSSRNSETGGVGLGLPIAMDIVHAHGGNITLDKSVHGGLCAIVRLPL